MPTKDIIQRASTHLVKYKPLIHELVIRDLKVKYRRSFLGYLWSLLNPLLMMTVMAVVFSTFFQTGIENYPLYLICGQTMYAFFTESSNMAMSSILASSTLLRKIYIPKFIFPISRVISSFVTMSFSLVAILIVMIATGAKFYFSLLLIVFPIFFLFLFCSGIGMALSALSVYFRDINHLWGVITLAWMYATPIFYTVDAMPPELSQVLAHNPLYHFIFLFRTLIMTGSLPEPIFWIKCAVSGLVSFIVGLMIFGKLQKSFILHI